METWLTQLLSGANGRHFRDDELYRVIAYVDTLPDRLEAAKAVAEQRDYLIRTLNKLFPDLSANNGLFADIVDMMHLVTHSMLVDDISILENKLADRLYALMVLMEFEQSQLNSILASFGDMLFARLTPKAKQLLEPYFSWVASHAGSFEGVLIGSV